MEQVEEHVAVSHGEPEEYDIIADRVTKAFDGQTAVSDASFAVQRGEIFGFIGPSGSGKTTTIRMMTGVYKPTGGRLSVLGGDPARFDRGTRELIGYLPQQFSLYPNLSALENMRFVASMYGISPLKRRGRIKRALHIVDLWDDRNKLASELSGGMQRRLMLASVMSHRPQLIFADEPTAGLDPVLREQLWTEFRRLREEGRTLFVTTQYVTEAEYCDHVALMVDGRIISNGTPEQLRRQAIGGEAVDVRVTGLTSSVLNAIETAEGVHGVEQRGLGELRIFVDDASVRLAQLVTLVQENGADASHVEEYRPNLDEVFVLLLEQHRGLTPEAAQPQVSEEPTTELSEEQEAEREER